jgi:Fur family ferric uptake transcriptional regulator
MSRAHRKLASVVKAPKPTMDDVRLQLRGAGLRSTAPRLAVLEFLRAAGRPMSHGEVATALEPRGFDRASIYRNLVDLTESKLVARRDFGDHVWRFEARVPGTPEGRAHEGEHPHFVCEECGDVECLPKLELKLPRGMSKRAVAVEVKGLCERCA